ncbi:MAG: magnesium transporter [Candidatus Thermoplasmatota archaeon]|nr:magnesium transporter [Candidatus Thermoplasmatota archaeon]
MGYHRSTRELLQDQTPFLLVMAALATGTGLVLRAQEASLFERPWLLALVPVVNALGGNLGSVLGARLTSALHLGTLEPRLTRGPLTANMGLTLGAGGTIYLLLAVVTFLVGPHLGLFPQLSFLVVLALVLGSGILLTGGVITLSLAAALVAYRRGLDPDDIVIPLVTNAADLLGVLILFGVSGVVL